MWMRPRNSSKAVLSTSDAIGMKCCSGRENNARDKPPQIFYYWWHRINFPRRTKRLVIEEGQSLCVVSRFHNLWHHYYCSWIVRTFRRISGIVMGNHGSRDTIKRMGLVYVNPWHNTVTHWRNSRLFLFQEKVATENISSIPSNSAIARVLFQTMTEQTTITVSCLKPNRFSNSCSKLMHSLSSRLDCTVSISVEGLFLNNWTGSAGI